MCQGNLKKPVVGSSDDDTITMSEIGSIKVNGGSGNDLINGGDGFEWVSQRR